ncbi:MAG: iron chelate uptake ABC transporter family permease subunit, partial [Paludibacteraceae bacterium]|nr:iron chelate uptake ABC transporter family permease subunit [Paludibacteraceae bacterium]
MESRKGLKFGILMAIAVCILFVCCLLFGSVDIPIGTTIDILTGGTTEKESWRFIILDSRLPQSVTALFCGAALATSGLML